MLHFLLDSFLSQHSWAVLFILYCLLISIWATAGIISESCNQRLVAQSSYDKVLGEKNGVHGVGGFQPSLALSVTVSHSPWIHNQTLCYSKKREVAIEVLARSIHGGFPSNPKQHG